MRRVDLGDLEAGGERHGAPRPRTLAPPRRSRRRSSSLGAGSVPNATDEGATTSSQPPSSGLDVAAALPRRRRRGLATGVRELDAGNSLLAADEGGDPLPGRGLLVVPDAGVRRRDATLGGDRRGLGEHQPGAAPRERARGARGASPGVRRPRPSTRTSARRRRGCGTSSRAGSGARTGAEARGASAMTTTLNVQPNRRMPRSRNRRAGFAAPVAPPVRWQPRLSGLAGVAQLAAHFTCNEGVRGSSPLAGSIPTRDSSCWQNAFHGAGGRRTQRAHLSKSGETFEFAPRSLRVSEARRRSPRSSRRSVRSSP